MFKFFYLLYIVIISNLVRNEILANGDICKNSMDCIKFMTWKKPNNLPPTVNPIQELCKCPNSLNNSVNCGDKKSPNYYCTSSVLNTCNKIVQSKNTIKDCMNKQNRTVLTK